MFLYQTYHVILQTGNDVITGRRWLCWTGSCWYHSNYRSSQTKVSSLFLLRCGC